MFMSVAFISAPALLCVASQLLRSTGSSVLPLFEKLARDIQRCPLQPSRPNAMGRWRQRRTRRPGSRRRCRSHYSKPSSKGPSIRRELRHQAGFRRKAWSREAWAKRAARAEEASKTGAMEASKTEAKAGAAREKRQGERTQEQRRQGQGRRKQRRERSRPGRRRRPA